MEACIVGSIALERGMYERIEIKKISHWSEINVMEIFTLDMSVPVILDLRIPKYIGSRGVSSLIEKIELLRGLGIRSGL